MDIILALLILTSAFLFLNFVYVSSYLRWHWAFAAACGLSLVAESGRLGSRCGVRASHLGGFSCFSSQGQKLWHRGLAALQHAGSPRSRIEPVSPALQGRLLTTGQPRKPLIPTLLKTAHLCLPSSLGCIISSDLSTSSPILSSI